MTTKTKPPGAGRREGAVTQDTTPAANPTPAATSAQLVAHPLADLVPAMSSGEFVELQRDIKKRGLLEPIWLYEGKILDGRHRAKACAELKIEPQTREYTGDDPHGFVLSMNLHRRHLNAEQKRKLVVELAKARPEMTDRAIAGATGVPKSTVSRHRREEEANGPLGHKPDRVESSGRKARGVKPQPIPKVTAEAPAPACEPVTESPDEIHARSERELDEVRAEVATLPEGEQEKFIRLWNKANKAMLRHYRQLETKLEADLKAQVERRFALYTAEQLRAQVDERVAAEQERLREQYAEVNELRHKLWEQTKTLDHWMTETEYKLVLGCLHPDKPDRTAASLDKAFKIFARLKGHLHHDGRVLRGRGWGTAFTKPTKPAAPTANGATT